MFSGHAAIPLSGPPAQGETVHTSSGVRHDFAMLMVRKLTVALGIKGSPFGSLICNIHWKAILSLECVVFLVLQSVLLLRATDTVYAQTL